MAVIFEFLAKEALTAVGGFLATGPGTNRFDSPGRRVPVSRSSRTRSSESRTKSTVGLPTRHPSRRFCDDRRQSSE